MREKEALKKSIVTRKRLIFAIFIPVFSTIMLYLYVFIKTDFFKISDPITTGIFSLLFILILFLFLSLVMIESLISKKAKINPRLVLDDENGPGFITFYLIVSALGLVITSWGLISILNYAKRHYICFFTDGCIPMAVLLPALWYVFFFLLAYSLNERYDTLK